MARMKQTGRGASGGGSIRQKTLNRAGKSYTYWEARYTAGYNPNTGRQIQRTITGKTKSEVAQKLRQKLSALCGVPMQIRLEDLLPGAGQGGDKLDFLGKFGNVTIQ